MSIMVLPKNSLVSTVVTKIQPADIVLDIGCGISPQYLSKPLIHICCEPHSEYIEHLQNNVTKGVRDRQYVLVHATWEEAVKLFPSKSVDIVFLLDVIEHVEKKSALKLLESTINLARKQVVLFTPLGFFPQEHPDGRDAWGLHGGKWQEHKSGWEPKDFDSSWDFYISENYHYVDNAGRPLTSPFGAFYAIKDIKGL